MRPTCLLYMPFTYDGRGVPEICATLSAGIAAAGVDVHAYVPRARRPLPAAVTTHQTLPLPLRYAPWRHVSKVAMQTLDRSFRRAVTRSDRSRTVAYFWPSYLHAPSLELLRFTRQSGIPTVREMVNTATATAGPILDAVYAKHGHPEIHNVSRELIAHEAAELPTYDHVFAPNPEVEASLLRVGVEAERVLATSFGWRRERFASDGPAQRLARGVRLLFVGIVGIRKGIPELLAAWEQAQVEGELVLVGSVEEAIAPLVERAAATCSVRSLGFVDDVVDLYRSSDIFVFPSVEEGGPQVTYEAAACGLPIITTPMGAARIVETGKTGVVVPPGDVEQLALAIRELAGSPSLRDRLGSAAREAAQQFEYSLVGRQRGEALQRIAMGSAG